MLLRFHSNTWSNRILELREVKFCLIFPSTPRFRRFDPSRLKSRRRRTCITTWACNHYSSSRIVFFFMQSLRETPAGLHALISYWGGVKDNFVDSTVLPSRFVLQVPQSLTNGGRSRRSRSFHNRGGIWVRREMGDNFSHSYQAIGLLALLPCEK